MKSIFTFVTLLLTLITATAGIAGQVAPLYAVAILPTPVLNTPDFAGVFGRHDGNSLRLDRCGQLRELEFIALPRTRFRIEETLGTGERIIYRITSSDYPAAERTACYIDSHFVSITTEPPPERPRTLQPAETIVANLLAAQGSTYVWGGNLRSGIPQLLELFPPHQRGRLTADTLRRWQLQGLDCSGLLYEATGGYTPRNTSELVSFGRGVPIAGLSVEEITKRLEPLDLLVWNGHVLIIIDRDRLIESRLDCTGKQGEVRVQPLRRRLAEIMKGRRPLDNYIEGGGEGMQGFVVRRWYPQER